MIVIGVIIACFVFKINPLTMLGLVSNGSSNARIVKKAGSNPDPETAHYLKTIKAYNEDVWKAILPKYNIKYRPSKMVIYEERTITGGGIADARMGPFYMPADETVYIDPSFFRELKEKFGAKGDFAEAYVIAHEVGHHIQKIIGRSDWLHRQQGRVSKVEYNHSSVRLELHADFLAGVFAHYGQEKFNFLENGDIQEAMDCAEAIGDNRIQERAQGYVQPDLFTHGTSAQRKRWFMLGYKTGDLRQGEQLFTLPYEDL